MLTRKASFGLAIIAASLLVTLAARLAHAQLAIPDTDTSIDVPTFPPAPDPCTGDVITFNGMSHLNVHIHSDGSGGFHVTTHFTAHDISALSEPSGLKYVADEDNLQEFNVKAGSEFTEHEIFHFVRQAELPGVYDPVINPSAQDDFFEHIYIHMTVTPNGMVPVNNFDDEFECR